MPVVRSRFDVTLIPSIKPRVCVTISPDLNPVEEAFGDKVVILAHPLFFLLFPVFAARKSVLTITDSVSPISPTAKEAPDPSEILSTENVVLERDATQNAFADSTKSPPVMVWEYVKTPSEALSTVSIGAVGFQFPLSWKTLTFAVFASTEEIRDKADEMLFVLVPYW